jgi:signal transduction histidine kinase
MPCCIKRTQAMSGGRLAAVLAGAWASRWSHQLVGFVIVVIVALGFHNWGSANLPRTRWIAGDLTYATVFVLWPLLYWRYDRTVAAGGNMEDAWYLYLLRLLWLFGLFATVLHWLQAPYSPPDRQIVSMLVTAILIAAGAIVTVRPPDRGDRGWAGTMVPAVVPMGILSYVIAEGASSLNRVVVLLFLFCLLMMALREFLQGQLNRAYAATLAAEAERDAGFQAKARFLAAASHDLDQPLQSARLFFDQFKRGSDDVTRNRASQRLDWAFETMQDMVHQVTQHLQLEAGATVPRREPVAIATVLARVLELNEPAAASRNINLKTLAIKGSVPGDATLIERALSNFVTNAIRHAGAKRILLGARRSKGRVRLWVIDDGRGIAEADRASLFEDYTQGSDHHGEQRGGFGLGLASARRMAELMGGSVGLDTSWRRGSAFFLDLAGA